MKRRSAAETEQAYQRAKADIETGEFTVREALKKHNISDPTYYSRKKRDKIAGKALGKRKYNKKDQTEISFKELSSPNSKTMIIVTEDATTVSNILIAAFGRGA